MKAAQAETQGRSTVLFAVRFSIGLLAFVSFYFGLYRFAETEYVALLTLLLTAALVDRFG